MLSKLKFANCLSIRSLSKLATAYEAMDQRGDVANLTYLNNGFRVASYINNKPTATVGVWVDAGSRYEDNDNNGIAMVFENMVHSGSSKMNSMQLQNELAKMGVQLSSYTTREHSAFFAECLSADVEKVVNILADVLCDTNIHQAKVEEQSATAVNRLEKFEEENHQGVIMDNLHMTAYQGTSMALSPLGNTKALNSLTAESVKKYVDNNYKPNRMVLACAGGDVNHENLHKIAEKCFGNMDNNYSEKIPSNVSPTSRVGLSYIPQTGVRFTGSEFLYRDDSYPYIHGCVAVEGLPRGHTDCLALELLKTYVGQWNRTYGASLNAPSNIIQNCSFNPEIMGFQSFNISYDNTGLFGFYFILKGEDIDQGTQALRPMQRAWKHFAVSVRDEEVDKAKNALKTNMFAVLESNNKLADYVATEALSTGKITPLEQLERKIEYLSTDTIRDAIMHQIYDREIAAVGVGKTETFPIYHEMRYAMSWWRL